jgi:galactonate dehydratase
VAEGWTAVKFDPAGPYTIRGGHMPGRRDIGLSAAFCEDIRAAVGDAADLLFGTHGQFIPGGAIRLAKAIEPSDPLWFEEPVPPDNFPALAEVARATSIPVATGERLTTKAEFAAALAHGARILQPALGRAGGIWEAKKIAILGRGRGRADGAAPLCRAGGMGGECASGGELPEHPDGGGDRNGVPRGAGDGAAPKVENGFVAAPSAPGLGIELNEDVAAAHPVTADRLHLEMQEAPCDWQNGNNFAGGSAD